MRNHAIAVASLLALLGAVYAQANDIYRWVDEDGNVHFEDRPVDEEAERLAIESRPTDPERVQAAAQARAEQRARAETAKAEAQSEQPTAEELRQEREERAEKCTAYKEQLQTYVNNRRLYRMTPDGEREYLSDEEINKTRDLAAQKVDEFCN